MEKEVTYTCDSAYVILQIGRHAEYLGTVLNVGYPSVLKELIRKKEAYSTDIEGCGSEYMTRKVVIPNCRIDSLRDLLDEFYSIEDYGDLDIITCSYECLPAIYVDGVTDPYHGGNDTLSLAISFHIDPSDSTGDSWGKLWDKMRSQVVNYQYTWELSAMEL